MEVAIPGDRSTEDKELGKIARYQDLKTKTLWHKLATVYIMGAKRGVRVYSHFRKKVEEPGGAKGINLPTGSTLFASRIVLGINKIRHSKQFFWTYNSKTSP